MIKLKTFTVGFAHLILSFKDLIVRSVNVILIPAARVEKKRNRLVCFDVCICSSRLNSMVTASLEMYSFNPPTEHTRSCRVLFSYLPAFLFSSQMFSLSRSRTSISHRRRLLG